MEEDRAAVAVAYLHICIYLHLHLHLHLYVHDDGVYGRTAHSILVTAGISAAAFAILFVILAMRARNVPLLSYLMNAFAARTAPA